MKKYNYLRILKEIFTIFGKFYRKLIENLGKNLENFGNTDLEGIHGRIPPPEASETFKKLVEKSMETCKILKS